MRLRLLPPDREKELGWTPYAWLVYLGFFLARPIVKGTAGEWLAAAAGLAVFLVLYFWTYWQQGRRVLWGVAAIAALGALFAPWNAGANVFWIYAASFTAFAGPARLAARATAVLLVALALESWLLDLSPFFWGTAALFSVLIAAVNTHFYEKARADAKLRMAQEEIERLATIAERERIARDLHDLLGHSLSLITLKAELAAKLALRDPVAAAREARDVERISREALREVRSAVTGYRALDLRTELSRARLALATAGVELDYLAEPLDLTPEQETALALGLREAVTNVIRHAKARHCRVRLVAQGGQARLEVEDDGRGGAAPEGAGLAGMRERVAALGGTLERRNERGMRLVLALPLERPDAAPAVASA